MFDPRLIYNANPKTASRPAANTLVPYSATKATAALPLEEADAAEPDEDAVALPDDPDELAVCEAPEEALLADEVAEAEAELLPDTSAEVALSVPQVTERQAVWPVRSLGCAATQLMIHCWHSKKGMVCW